MDVRPLYAKEHPAKGRLDATRRRDLRHPKLRPAQAGEWILFRARRKSFQRSNASFGNNFDLFGPFCHAKTLSPVKAVIEAAHLKEKPP
jgi:hypothetical protein